MIAIRPRLRKVRSEPGLVHAAIAGRFLRDMFFANASLAQQAIMDYTLIQ